MLSSNVSVKIRHPSEYRLEQTMFCSSVRVCIGGAFLNPILYVFPLIWADFMLLILLYVFITNVPNTQKRKAPIKASRTPGCRVALHYVFTPTLSQLSVVVVVGTQSCLTLCDPIEA